MQSAEVKVESIIFALCSLLHNAKILSSDISNFADRDTVKLRVFQMNTQVLIQNEVSSLIMYLKKESSSPKSC